MWPIEVTINLAGNSFQYRLSWENNTAELKLWERQGHGARKKGVKQEI